MEMSDIHGFLQIESRRKGDLAVRGSSLKRGLDVRK